MKKERCRTPSGNGWRTKRLSRCHWTKRFSRTRNTGGKPLPVSYCPAESNRSGTKVCPIGLNSIGSARKRILAKVIFRTWPSSLSPAKYYWTTPPMTISPASDLRTFAAGTSFGSELWRCTDFWADQPVHAVSYLASLADFLWCRVFPAQLLYGLWGKGLACGPDRRVVSCL